MRLPRPTTRRLMATVAITALLLGSLAWIKRRHSRWLRIAAEHDDRVVLKLGPGDQATVENDSKIVLSRAGWSITGGEFHILARDGAWVPITKEVIVRDDWHRAMKQKYLHAARYPWLPVWPDPPPP